MSTYTNDVDDYDNHPAADVFPMLPLEDLHRLAADIKDHGLRESVAIYSGKVLDGRNRLAACKLAGVEPHYRVVDEVVDDPLAYVLSRNLHRRQLSKTQRALAAARSLALFAARAKTRQAKGGGAVPAKVPEALRSDSRDEAGRAFGVGGKYVDMAAAVLKNAETDSSTRMNLDLVERGKLPLKQAYDRIPRRRKESTVVPPPAAAVAEPAEPDLPADDALRTVSDLIARYDEFVSELVRNQPPVVVAVLRDHSRAKWKSLRSTAQ